MTKPVPASAQATHGRNPGVLPPREAALRIGISRSTLRKLTLAGKIGHVRLGTGSQRQHIGYTLAQIDAFIAARTVPPKETALPAATGASPRRPIVPFEPILSYELRLNCEPLRNEEEGKHC